MRTILTDRHADRETDKPVAIGEILQICLIKIEARLIPRCFSRVHIHTHTHTYIYIYIYIYR